MISYRTTTTLLGLILCAIIFALVRRGKLQEKYSLAWFGVGLLVVILGAFPRIVDAVAAWLGVTYPPALLFVIAIGILLVQCLFLFAKVSENEARIRELIQQTAVLNRLVEELMDRKEPDPPPAPDD